MIRLLLATVAVLFLLNGCAQFTTNDDEQAALRAQADAKADDYLACITREAQPFLDTSSDASFILDTADARCTPQMAAYTEAEEAFVVTEVMMTEKPVALAVDNLQTEGRNQIAEMVAAQRSGMAPVTAAGAPLAAPSAAPVVAGQQGWSEQERVYLDCMLDQAKRYSGLQETADVIAEVAANRCSTYLRSSNAAALASEGRALVLGAVMDARLDPLRGR